ncbi:unnamed protein product [Amoebophrya sp. A25]|nr:unnamed protein product [Amoebophrya sp. A25]|eukprot:GSA25T00012321001.1
MGESSGNHVKLLALARFHVVAIFSVLLFCLQLYGDCSAAVLVAVQVVGDGHGVAHGAANVAQAVTQQAGNVAQEADASPSSDKTSGSSLSSGQETAFDDHSSDGVDSEHEVQSSAGEGDASSSTVLSVSGASSSADESGPGTQQDGTKVEEGNSSSGDAKGTTAQEQHANVANSRLACTESIDVIPLLEGGRGAKHNIVFGDDEWWHKNNNTAGDTGDDANHPTSYSTSDEEDDSWSSWIANSISQLLGFSGAAAEGDEENGGPQGAEQHHLRVVEEQDHDEKENETAFGRDEVIDRPGGAAGDAGFSSRTNTNSSTTRTRLGPLSSFTPAHGVPGGQKHKTSSGAVFMIPRVVIYGGGSSSSTEAAKTAKAPDPVHVTIDPTSPSVKFPLGPINLKLIMLDENDAPLAEHQTDGGTIVPKVAVPVVNYGASVGAATVLGYNYDAGEGTPRPTSTAPADAGPEDEVLQVPQESHEQSLPRLLGSEQSGQTADEHKGENSSTKPTIPDDPFVSFLSAGTQGTATQEEFSSAMSSIQPHQFSTQFPTTTVQQPYGGPMQMVNTIPGPTNKLMNATTSTTLPAYITTGSSSTQTGVPILQPARGTTFMVASPPVPFPPTPTTSYQIANSNSSASTPSISMGVGMPVALPRLNVAHHLTASADQPEGTRQAAVVQPIAYGSLTNKIETLVGKRNFFVRGRSKGARTRATAATVSAAATPTTGTTAANSTASKSGITKQPVKQETNKAAAPTIEDDPGRSAALTSEQRETYTREREDAARQKTRQEQSHQQPVRGATINTGSGNVTNAIKTLRVVSNPIADASSSAPQPSEQERAPSSSAAASSSASAANMEQQQRLLQPSTATSTGTTKRPVGVVQHLVPSPTSSSQVVVKDVPEQPAAPPEVLDLWQVEGVTGPKSAEMSIVDSRMIPSPGAKSAPLKMTAWDRQKVLQFECISENAALGKCRGSRWASSLASRAISAAGIGFEWHTTPAKGRLTLRVTGIDWSNVEGYLNLAKRFVRLGGDEPTEVILRFEYPSGGALVTRSILVQVWMGEKK